MISGTSTRDAPRTLPALARAWARRLPWDVWAVLGIGAVALVPRLTALGAFSVEYDEGVYWQSLRALAAGHPLYSQVFSSQPPLFLALVLPLFLIFGQTLAAARLGVAVLSLIGIGALFSAGRMLGGRWAGVLAAALLALDPLYLRQSITLQAEAPAVAFAALAVALAVAATRHAGHARARFAVASGAALSVGLLIKLFAVVALVPVVIYLAAPVFPLWLGADGRPRLPAWAALRPELRARLRAVAPDLGWLAVGLFGAALVVLLPLASRWGDLYQQVVSYHFAAAQTASAGLGAQAHLIARGVGWLPLALPALLAVGLLVWRRWWGLLPPLLWALASLLLLLGQQPLFAHHVVLLSAPLALAGGLGLALGARELRAGRVRLPEWGEVSLVRAAVLLVLAGAVVFGLGRSLDLLASTSAYVPLDQLRMALSLEAATPYGEVVITDDPYV
ncbi:MAG TPA: glycosyltransferase family 39 protein, partial [Ktedonobacterales bacterium]